MDIEKRDDGMYWAKLRPLYPPNGRSVPTEARLALDATGEYWDKLTDSSSSIEVTKTLDGLHAEGIHELRSVLHLVSYEQKRDVELVLSPSQVKWLGQAMSYFAANQDPEAMDLTARTANLAAQDMAALIEERVE